MVGSGVAAVRWVSGIGVWEQVGMAQESRQPRAGAASIAQFNSGRRVTGINVC